MWGMLLYAVRFLGQLEALASGGNVCIDVGVGAFWVACLWSFDGHPAGEGDICGSEQGLNTEVWLNRLVSAVRSVCVRGGPNEVIQWLVIGCRYYVAERGCTAGAALVGTLC